MRTKILSFIIVALVIIALVLGFKIYEKYYPATKPTNQPTNQSITPTISIPVVSNTNNSEYSDKYFSTLSPDEKKIVGLDLSNADILKNDSQLLEGAAKETDSLDVTNCEPQPLVIKLHLNQSFHLKNSDSTSHTILTGKFQIIASPSASVNALADFPKGEGIYSYYCDSSIKGVFYVTK